MNGIALLLMAATLGVEYDWQALDDGQIEYSLIVEPDFIAALGEGSEIRSSVPDVLESVQRLCIRIAPPAKNGVVPPTAARKLPPDAFRSSRIGLRAAEPMTILWKGVGQPEETTLVRYGWQPTKEGQLEYFVQIDPKLLRTLVPGDEIYATLSPEAGKIETFVVFSNAKQLPRVPGKPGVPAARTPESGNLATNPPAAGSAPFAPAPFAAPNAFSPAAPPPASSTSFGPPAAPPTSGFNSPSFSSTSPGLNEKAPPLYPPPRSFGVTDDPVNDPASRVNPATNYGPAAPAATDNVRGYQWENNRNDLPRPNLNSNNLNTGLTPPANQPFRNDGYGATGARDQQPLNPPANDLYPNNFANNQNGNLRPNGQQLPSAGNAPYRPNVGYPQDNNLANQNPNNSGPNNQGYNNPNFNNQGFSNPPLPPNPQAVGYGPMNDNQMASLPNNNSTSMRPNSGNDLRNPGVGNDAAMPPATPKEKPWWTLVFVTFTLFVSLGANLYLVWTAMEFYSRYRLAVERLRTSSTRA